MTKPSMKPQLDGQPQEERGAAQKQEEYLRLQELRAQNGHNLQNFNKKGVNSNQLTP
jgi:hypothetical protein